MPGGIGRKIINAEGCIWIPCCPIMEEDVQAKTGVNTPMISTYLSVDPERIAEQGRIEGSSPDLLNNQK